MNNDQDIFKPFDEQSKRMETVPIYEMANVAPEDHNFGVALKMHVLQPGDRWPGHGPRVKFFIKSPDVDFFSISLHPEASRISVVDGNPDELATTSEVNLLVRKVQHYRVPLWNMYFDSGMTQRDLIKEMQAVDAGKEVSARGGRYKMDKKKRL